MESGIFVLVADRGDSFAHALRGELDRRGVAHRSFDVGTLADVPVSLERNAFQADGEAVAGILFRATAESRFSQGFDDADQRFCDLEIGSTWLAALQLGSILAINRLDAGAWYEDGWPFWRERAAIQGIPLAPLAVGDTGLDAGSWCPYTAVPRPAPAVGARAALGAAVSLDVGRDRWLFAAGQPLDPSAPTSVWRVAKELSPEGLILGAAWTDSRGDLLTIDPYPLPAPNDDVERAAELLGERAEHHSRHR